MRQNYKFDNAAVLRHFKRSQADRDAEREAQHMANVATWVLVGIAGTFLAVLYWG